MKVGQGQRVVNAEPAAASSSRSVAPEDINALRERILRERSAETQLRRQTRERIQKYNAVAEELQTLAQVGITEELLKRRQTLSRSSSASGYSLASSSARRQQLPSAATSSTSGSNSARENGSKKMTGNQHDPRGSDHSRQDSRRRKISGSDGNDDNDDALSEDHVVVISTDAQNALLHTVSRPQNVAEGPAADGRSGVGPVAGVLQREGRAASGSIEADNCPNRVGTGGTAEVQPIARAREGGARPTRSISAPIKPPSGHESGMTAAAPSRLPQHRTPSSAATTAAGQPKSILKRFPLRRKHSRRVHFSEHEQIVLHVSLTSSAKQDSLQDAVNQVAVLLRSSTEEVFSTALRELASANVQPENNGISSKDSPQSQWGADSSLFAMEWGLQQQQQNRQPTSSALPIGARLAKPPLIAPRRTSSGVVSEQLVSRTDRDRDDDKCCDRKVASNDSQPCGMQQGAPPSAGVGGGVLVPVGPITSMFDKNAAVVLKCVPHTRVADTSKTVTAPDVGEVTCAGVLPQRKSDHASLSRRDRFGRKVGLVPQ